MSAALKFMDDDFVTEHANLVRFCAQKIKMRLPDSILMDDLIQAGTMGLLEAGRRYDPNRGFNFKTFAEFRIRGAILDYLRGNDIIPRSIRDKKKVYAITIQELKERLGRRPSRAEIGEVLELTSDEVFRLEQVIAPATVISIDHDDLNQGDRRCLLELLTGGETVEEKLINKIHHKRKCELFAAYIAKQKIRDMGILDLYFFKGLRMKLIARRFQLCEGRISQIVKKHGLLMRKMIVDYETTEPRPA